MVSQFNNDNLSWENGNLRLTASLANPDHSGNWIWTACLTSKARSFKQGMYAEARIKVANLSMPSSFWMKGKHNEIDVIENWGEVKRSSP